MKKLIIFLISSVFLAGTAFAIPSSVNWAVDFRDAEDWAAAKYKTSYEGVDGITASALPGGKKLYWDDTDGLGILGGEQDEIDLIEQLQIGFEDGIYANGIWITDLFDAPDGGSDGENGQVTLTILDGDDQIFDFSGLFKPGQGNGEFFVDFHGIYNIKSALFSVPGGDNSAGNEFSVAGFTAAPVPEPATLLMFGTGLLGLAGIRRKTKK